MTFLCSLIVALMKGCRVAAGGEEAVREVASEAAVVGERSGEMGEEDRGARAAYPVKMITHTHAQEQQYWLRQPERLEELAS